MGYRLFSIVVTGMWLLAMGLLVRDDVLPVLTAQAPPDMASQLADEPEYRELYNGVYDQTGRRVGHSTTAIIRGPEYVSINSRLELEPGWMDRLDMLARVVRQFGIAGKLEVRTALRYVQDGSLDEFTVDIEGLGMPVRIESEYFGTDFGAQLTVGQAQWPLVFDTQISQRLGQSFDPFIFLPELQVGKSWRVWMASFSDVKPRFEQILVRVVDREMIDHHGRQVHAYRVEAGDLAVAWADRSGKILRQEVNMPLLGRITILDETEQHRARQGDTRCDDAGAEAYVPEDAHVD